MSLLKTLQITQETYAFRVLAEHASWQSTRLHWLVWTLIPRHRVLEILPPFANEQVLVLSMPEVMARQLRFAGCGRTYLYKFIFGMFLEQLVAGNNCGLV